MKHLYIITILSFIGCSTSFGQTITNGGMEDWPAGCPFNSIPDSWTNFTIGSSSLGPDQAGTCYGSVFAYEGDSYMNIVFTSTAEEGAEYTVTGLTAGYDYTLSFYARNTNGTYASAGSGSIDVFHDGLVVYTTPEMTAPGSWTEYTADFTAVSASDMIGFRIFPGTGGSGSLGIDAVTISGGPVTGIEKAEDLSFSVYPNPTEGIFNIRFDENEIKSVTLTDMLGKIVYHSTEVPQEMQVDLSTKQAGTYFLKVESAVGTEVRKINLK